ncbi:glycerophosphodiester phosphodiesterase domain-containing protein 5-like [Leptodactylus fuscus]|uniref:glycerophosphodiester phosphodiesterase domain-containing protein 5-like n=1 Tax=Leptodactylus fuscus TaxID=238119 RepID=UPI003F4E5B99
MAILRTVCRSLLQRYQHQSFISLLTGLYSCRWRQNQHQYTEPGHCCCKWLEFVFFILVVVTFFVTIIFLYFWGEAKNDFHEFDWSTFTKTGSWFLWSLLILVVVVLVVIYLAILIVLALCLLSEGQQLHLHGIHKGVILVVLISFIAGLIALSKLWDEEWPAILMSFQLTAPYLHVGSLAIMTLLSWPVALYFARIKRELFQVLIIGPYIAVLLVLYFVPLGMYSPCIMVNTTNMSKPFLIANRGFPMHAPENTNMSFMKAIEYGADGLMADVRISKDGIPFLMHDPDLKRTTDVMEIFSNRTNTDAESFRWDELASLSASKWFMKKPPFSDMKSLSPAEQEMVVNQNICKLADFLELASKENKMVIFDSDAPENAVLEVIKNSGIDKNQVFWLTNHMGGYSDYQKIYSGKGRLKDLKDNDIRNVSLPYSMMSQHDISVYAVANITTNLYVISEPWLFSLAWCSGAHSVTTNNIELLKDMTAPMFLMTPAEYNVMWTLSDIFSGLLIILIFVLHWWRERGFPCLPKSELHNASILDTDSSIYEPTYSRHLPLSLNA